jgi:hypothetical protein
LIDRLERILTMVYVVQSYWACFGLYPSSTYKTMDEVQNKPNSSILLIAQSYFCSRSVLYRSPVSLHCSLILSSTDRRLSDVASDKGKCKFDFLVAVTAGTEAVVPDFCRDSSVDIAMDYGLDVWGSIPDRGKFFSPPRLPDQLRDPTEVLFNGYGGRFSRG